MADMVGPPPIRASDSWSSTEVRSVEHSHVWTVKGFSKSECRYLETQVKFPANNSAAAPNNGSGPNGPGPIEISNFRIRLHPQGNKESNKDFTFFQVFNNSQAYKFKAKFAVYNARNEEITTTVYTGTQQLHGYFEYIRRDLLLSHILPQDELHLVLTLTSTQDTVTKSSQASRPAIPEARQEEVASDLEAFWGEKPRRYTDFVIEAGGLEIRVHRAILAARSPVFAAMLEGHTEEAAKGRVAIPDVEGEVMSELLGFLYSGRAPQLSVMAPELLAAADRWGLPGLKEMADLFLRSTLSTDSVCRVLVLADMHNSRDLKSEAVKFVAAHSPQIITTDGWAQMLKSHPDLVTEVVAAISLQQNPGSSSSASSSGSGSGTSGNPAAAPKPSSPSLGPGAPKRFRTGQ